MFKCVFALCRFVVGDGVCVWGGGGWGRAGGGGRALRLFGDFINNDFISKCMAQHVRLCLWLNPS